MNISSEELRFILEAEEEKMNKPITYMDYGRKFYSMQSGYLEFNKSTKILWDVTQIHPFIGKELLVIEEPNSFLGEYPLLDEA